MQTRIVFSRRSQKALVFLLASLAVSATFAAGATRVAPRDAADAKRVLGAADYTGGLIVHLGCGDGRLTAALHAGDGSLVHGLESDAAQVTGARKHIHGLGLYGKVSVDAFDGKHLPYADNLVNLLVVSRPLPVDRNEILRVLCPGGVALVSGARDQGSGARSEKTEIGGSTWTKTVKPWPDEIDQWPHFLHGANRSPPGLRWSDRRRRAAVHHDHRRLRVMLGVDRQQTPHC